MSIEEFGNELPKLNVAYHTIACGTYSLLWRAALEAKRTATQLQIRDFFKALDQLNEACTRLIDQIPRYQEQKVALGPLQRDRTIAPRLRGFRRVLEAVLGVATDKANAFSQAAEAFEEAWTGDKPPLPDETAKALKDDPIFRAYPTLPLERLGGWIAYDMLWHLQHSQPGSSGNVGVGGLSACEKIPFLTVTANVGRVFKIAAEVLPGPSGLVTPDWWAMGLHSFSQPREEDDSERDADFVLSTQQLLLALPHPVSEFRLRWRIEPYVINDELFGNSPIAGRSGEGAVVCVGSAAYEKLAYPDEAPVLNSSMAITAMVDKTDPDPDVRNRLLRPVSDGSILPKFTAAALAGLSEVLVAVDQKPIDLPTPAVHWVKKEGEVPPPQTNLRSTRVHTVQDALIEIAAANVFVRNYQDFTHAAFKKRWIMEETRKEETPQ